jgi:hypothetical protein
MYDGDVLEGDRHHNIIFNLGVNKKLIFNSGKNIFSRWILNLFFFHYLSIFYIYIKKSLGV